MADKSEEGAAAERAELQRALRDARGSWQDGNGVRGPQPVINPAGDSSNLERRTDAAMGSVTRRGGGADLPGAPALPVASTASLSLNASFLLKEASTTVNGVITRKVLVMDGKVNGHTPAGMGGGNFVLTIANPDDCIIYVGVTFDPTTLMDHSWFVATSSAGEMPESRVESNTLGFLYWQLGYTYVVPPPPGSSGAGQFQLYQSRLGDINFQLVYGAQNGVPALLPVMSDPGWLDLEGMT